MSNIALITGGNRGLGFATARALARAGNTTIIASRDESRARDAAEQLIAEGLDAEWLVLDVTSSSSVADAAKRVRERHEHLDILINNAGILPEATDSVEHEFADPAMFQQTFDTNVVGAVTVIEAFLPLLRGSEAGRIVNVSSTMGSLVEQANPDSPYYAMVVPAYQSSKAALNSITIGLSKKLADTDIKVTSVCPGFVQTDLTRHQPGAGAADRRPSSAGRAHGGHPARRRGVRHVHRPGRPSGLVTRPCGPERQMLETCCAIVSTTRLSRRRCGSPQRGEALLAALSGE